MRKGIRLGRLGGFGSHSTHIVSVLLHSNPIIQRLYVSRKKCEDNISSSEQVVRYIAVHQSTVQQQAMRCRSASYSTKRGREPFCTVIWRASTVAHSVNTGVKTNQKRFRSGFNFCKKCLSLSTCVVLPNIGRYDSALEMFCAGHSFANRRTQASSTEIQIFHKDRFRRAIHA